MREQSLSEKQLQTKDRLKNDMLKMGIKPAMNLIVHSSLSSIGWVLGGAPTVINALLEILTEEGTLAMPATTPHCSDPADWTEIRIPKALIKTAREHLPVFDPHITPTTMGVISETFRTWPGTMRSIHPLESVCARGPLALEITREHPLPFSEGKGTPFDKLYELDSWILLLGVGFNRCTALHFAESLVEKRRTMKVRFPLMQNGRRVWLEVPNVADDNDTHFPIVGEKYVTAGRVTKGIIGEAQSMLFPMRDLVAFAVSYFEDVL